MPRLSSLHISLLHRLAYANNQKAGCTTVKYTLWRDHDRLTGRRTFKGATHDRDASPFLTGEEAARALTASDRADLTVFALVRHPATRVLSGWLHHIADDAITTRVMRSLGLWRSARLRRATLETLGFGPSERVSFSRFLEHLDRFGTDGLVGHFRPQVTNTDWQSLRFDQVFQLEKPDVLKDWFEGRGIPFYRRSPHAQNSDQRALHLLGPQERLLIRRIYADDFAAFGYDPEDVKGAGFNPQQAPTALPLSELIAKTMP